MYMEDNICKLLDKIHKINNEKYYIKGVNQVLKLKR